jgi:putative tryptophan/tyrosine transport system substrate-binding protein
MRRRKFFMLFGGSAAEWPLAAWAQQSAMPVIGFLSALGQPPTSILDPFFQGLSASGYVVGRNVSIEHRVTTKHDQLAALASDLVQRQVSVIFAFGTANSVRAAKAATARMPIAFANGDAVALGLVASIISRPGGNVTGVSFLRVLILDLHGVLVLT